MAIEYGQTLRDFDSELARLHIRGQWLPDPARRESSAQTESLAVRTEPRGSGVPYLWRWAEVYPELLRACEALPESHTARRALAFKNPELPRCTAQTINMAIQAIRPHEIAWAHRHTIAAIRFVIRGDAELVTVVDGVPYAMHENDLILTPSWSWHEHRNDSDAVAFWVDVLDVPFVGGLNVGFYEELGDVAQTLAERPVRNDRFAWSETEPRLRSGEEDPYDGVTVRYADRARGGPTLPTLECAIHRLPPGFSGRLHRHTSSTVYHVVSGEGRTEAGETTLRWSARDSFVVPNWTRHRHENLSATEEAIVFSVSDAPAMRALGWYREEP